MRKPYGGQPDASHLAIIFSHFQCEELVTQQPLPLIILIRQLILGLDIGTSSVRAALYDLQGNLLPDTLVKNERALTVTNDGGAEIDGELALKQVVATIDETLRLVDRRDRIEYVASSAFWHSLIGVDSRGNPTTKLFGWADIRSSKFTRPLRKRFDEQEIHNRTGAHFHAGFWPAKLLWLRDEHPQAFQRTAVWLSFSDFLALRFFGIAATSVSMASGTGIFDIRTRKWHSQMSRFAGVTAGSLPLVSTGSYTFSLTGKFKKRWPRLRSAQWFPAIGDGAANNIGTGCLKRSRAALMIGTSGAMRVAYKGEPPEQIPTGLWCYRIDENRVIAGGALSDGGGLYRWLKDNLRLTDDDNIEAEIAKRAPAAHGLTVLPFFAGERSTGYHENAAGSIIGLRSSTDAIDIVQASLEAIAYRLAEIFDRLGSMNKITDIVASGGALRESPLWTQIVADVLGRDLTLPDTKEASMRGAVLLALETTGKIESIESIPSPPGKKISADKSRKAIYAKARKQHQETYKLLIDRVPE